MIRRKEIPAHMWKEHSVVYEGALQGTAITLWLL